MSAPGRERSPATTRLTVAAALVVLLVLGVVSLPLVASVVDGQGAENWILPVQLGAMALVGAGTGWLVPRLGGASAGRRRGALVGAAIGVGFAVLGLVVFFLLLNGISGA